MNIVNNSVVQYCNASSGRIAAVHANGKSQFTIMINTFQDYGAGTVGGTGSYSYIRNNQFFRNHREFPYANSPGGQIFIDYNSNTMYIQDNWLDGGYVGTPPQWSTGLEIYGSGHQIYRNQVQSHRGARNPHNGWTKYLRL